MKRFLTVISVLMATLELHAQEIERRDTIRAAVKTDTRRIEVAPGTLQTGMEGVRTVASPLGEGDAVRWAQSLPGVTSGADGTTSMYVRGGGSGNNLFTLDGVPVYGYSHILGLTTIVPTEVTDNVSLSKGGFDGSESNFTAAHLRMVSKTPSERVRANAALNNFLVSAESDGPIGRNLSYIISARYSPLTYEYRGLRGSLPDIVNGLDDFTTRVGDVYAKLGWRSAHSSIDASFLGSGDSYAFDMPDDSHEELGWKNMVGLLRYTHEGEDIHLELSASANRYGSMQEQLKLYRGQENHLSLKSDMEEYAVSGIIRQHGRDRSALSGGFDARLGRFAPGQVGDGNSYSNTLLMNAWGQADYRIPDMLALKAVVRGHGYTNLAAEGNTRFDLDGSVSARMEMTDRLSLEMTADRMVQYYHTLEGMPIGWSLDMVVPTGRDVRPESMLQANVGLTAKTDLGTISLGGFYKSMDGLIYYKYAQSLFGGALASWEDHVDFGNGTAYGAEFLYEYQGRELYARLAYTLSRTMRHGFAETNDGRPFHARFDRPHVLNAMAQWKFLTAAFILQSGNWENGAAETYTLHLPGKTWPAKYYSGVNNYQMPTVIRLDLGCQFGFSTGPVYHKVGIGICNVTNHFNPFMLYFDASTETWKELALLPILPNFSWRVEF